MVFEGKPGTHVSASKPKCANDWRLFVDQEMDGVRFKYIAMGQAVMPDGWLGPHRLLAEQARRAGMHVRAGRWRIMMWDKETHVMKWSHEEFRCIVGDNVSIDGDIVWLVAPEAVAMWDKNARDSERESEARAQRQTREEVQRVRKAMEDRETARVEAEFVRMWEQAAADMKRARGARRVKTEKEEMAVVGTRKEAGRLVEGCCALV